MPKKYWWFPFDPNDWYADLAEHPLEIEGAWIRTITRIWDTGEGTKTIEQWARLLGVTVEKAWSIMCYISSEKIGDVTLSHVDVTVTNRRLNREYNKRVGNKIRKQREREKNTGHADVAPKEKKRKRIKKPKADYTESFNKFWDAWPRKVAKADAVKAWNKLAPDAELTIYIIERVNLLAQTDDWLKDGGRYIPHPATWLNGRRWEDEIEGKKSELDF